MNRVARIYEAFATREAHGASRIYEDWALGVVGDEQVQSLIATLPPLKRQANLVFAAARHVGAPLVDYAELREWLVSAWDEVASVVLSRSTQTNEAARCATLLPQLASIDGPIALLEVGASAGLCLYPDRYSYRFRSSGGVSELDPNTGRSAVVLDCDLLGEVDAPTRLPEVVWRAGIDLNPLDLTDSESMRWLETLVWPEHDARRARLHAAASIVTGDPPLLVSGDLTSSLFDLAAEAPANATLIVFHSAVLAYLSQLERHAFAETVSALDAIWLSNEGIGVLPRVAEQLPSPIEAHGSFVLSRNGHAVALTGGHGQWYLGLAEPQPPRGGKARIRH